ncbi:hypothetical protein M5D96_013054 [Drosophila gunungcola]|uniref:Uncharacterized protein n=1 Tax=Drosophila gunungcola TaxID=103775 RepID=A0A9P9YC30_9MUSC|nr:hypothetical protein M5D96_013054 [Drosophila gunungcola]
MCVANLNTVHTDAHLLRVSKYLRIATDFQTTRRQLKMFYELSKVGHCANYAFRLWTSFGSSKVVRSAKQKNATPISKKKYQLNYLVS